MVNKLLNENHKRYGKMNNIMNNSKQIGNIGTIIRERRIGKGLSQNELSKRANVSRTFLNMVENGHCQPSMNTLEVIASRLDEDVNKLIDEANREGGDSNARLLYLIGKLINDKDSSKVDKLIELAESLQTK